MRARGAEILAEVIGYAMSSDASDIDAVKTGAVRAISGVKMQVSILLM